MRVKICGLSTASTVAAAVSAQASYVGFVFFENSPRNVSKSLARELALGVPSTIRKVALTVNATDAMLDGILAEVPLDMLQLHGDESPERALEVKDKFGLPVMKAVGVSGEADMPILDEYSEVVDQLLVDAKPRRDADLPGGNGIAFDWRLIAGRRWAVPWMLAGGLVPENVAEAVRLTGARQVDVSSGVECAPGVKDARRIAAFCKSSRG